MTQQEMTSYAMTFLSSTPSDTMLAFEQRLLSIVQQYPGASLTHSVHLLTVTFPTAIYEQIVTHLWRYRIQPDIAPRIQEFTVGSLTVAMPQEESSVS